MVKVFALLTAFLISGLGLLVGLDVLHYSAAEVAFVTADITTGMVLIGAAYFHFEPDTQAQPVALAAALTAFTQAFLATLVGFAIWTLTDAQIALILGFEGSTIALVGAVLVWRRVTPVPVKYPVDAIPPANAPRV